MLSDKKENIGHCSKIRPISFVVVTFIHCGLTDILLFVLSISLQSPNRHRFFSIATGPLRFSLLTMLHKYTVRMIAIY